MGLSFAGYFIADAIEKFLKLDKTLFPEQMVMGQNCRIMVILLYCLPFIFPDTINRIPKLFKFFKLIENNFPLATIHFSTQMFI